MTKKIPLAVTSEARMVLLEPSNPETKPDEKSASAKPREMNGKMLAARAWLVWNSSSINGRMGEKRVLPLKFINQMNQMNRRKRNPLP